MASLGPGNVIAGKYRLVDLLGKGAMGEVWRAEHTSLGAPVAIKLIDVELLGADGGNENSEIVQRFFREAKAAAALRSPHVVQILDHGYDDSVPYIAMEMLEGETLEQRLDRERKLPPLMTATILTHIARAMGKAHEAGIVHRDLKPSNVFLVKNDDEEIAKVLDFGIAKATGGGVLGSQGGLATRTGSVVGTPCYMSPEQALGNKTIDSRADLWALGVMAFECVCGQRPFDSEALGDLIVQICARPLPVPSAVAPVPEGFDAWFAKACAREPSERFQSSKELAEALRWVLCPDQSGVFQFKQTNPSLPNVVVSRPSAPGAEPSAMAKTAAVDPTTMTHRGLVSAVADTPTSSKKLRPVVLAGVAAAVVLGGITIAVLSSTGGTPTSTPAAPGDSTSLAAPPNPTPSSAVTPATNPVASASAVPPAASGGEAGPATSAASPATTSSKVPNTKTSTTTKKSGTKKPPNWGF